MKRYGAPASSSSTGHREPSPEAFFQAGTGFEPHGLEVDYDIFHRVTPPHPHQRQAVYHADDYDFRLRPNTAAVDSGVSLPSISDGARGRGPDLGAIELVDAPTVYGPRSKQP